MDTNNITAKEGLIYFIEKCKSKGIKTILDIGCGIDQPHAKILRSYGFEVLTCDFFEDNDYIGLFNEIDFGDTKFDAVWCAHCLEHQTDVGSFLRKIKSVVKENGVICITVPPLKHKIVGGHLTLWNIGLLYYNLILAGFDCSRGRHKRYRYNLTVCTEVKTIENFPELKYDCGDIETLSGYFPFAAKQNFCGDSLADTF